MWERKDCVGSGLVWDADRKSCNAPNAQDVEDVEDEVGIGSGAWDMVDPEEILKAAWFVFARRNDL